VKTARKPSLIGRVMDFARSEQGKKMIRQATDYAKSEKGRQQLAQARAKANSIYTARKQRKV
jgi:hypothetical protein